MGEAGKEHQALLLHCIVEVAGNAEGIMLPILVQSMKL